MAKSRRICDRVIQTCPACHGLGWKQPTVIDAWPVECDVCRGPGVLTVGWIMNFTGLDQRLVGRILDGKGWRAKGKLDAVLDKLDAAAAMLDLLTGSHARA